MESGSDHFNIPTPLRWTPRIHHVSSDENISSKPSTPCTTATGQSCHKPVHCQLSYRSSDNEESSTAHVPSNYSTLTPHNTMGFCTTATIQVHLHCMWWLRRVCIAYLSFSAWMVVSPPPPPLGHLETWSVPPSHQRMMRRPTTSSCNIICHNCYKV